jgi:hypothetical protein
MTVVVQPPRRDRDYRATIRTATHWTLAKVSHLHNHSGERGGRGAPWGGKLKSRDKKVRLEEVSMVGQDSLRGSTLVCVEREPTPVIIPGQVGGDIRSNSASGTVTTRGEIRKTLP